MNNLNLKPALRYQLTYAAQTSALCIGIATAILIFFKLFFTVGGFSSGEAEAEVNIMGFVQVSGENANITSNMGFLFVFVLFFFGVGYIREDLRIMVQHGMGRRTVYTSTLLSSLTAGCVLGLLCELLNLAGNIWAGFPMVGFTFTGMQGYTAQSFVSGWLLHMLCFFFAWQLGALISLIFYRMNKMQQVVFSALTAALVVFGMRWSIISLLTDEAAALVAFGAIFAKPLALVLLVFVLGILAAAGNFLLLRRVQIKEIG